MVVPEYLAATEMVAAFGEPKEEGALPHACVPTHSASFTLDKSRSYDTFAHRVSKS
jgi:hypothetical protein